MVGGGRGCSSKGGPGLGFIDQSGFANLKIRGLNTVYTLLPVSNIIDLIRDKINSIN